MTAFLNNFNPRTPDPVKPKPAPKPDKIYMTKCFIRECKTLRIKGKLMCDDCFKVTFEQRPDLCPHSGMHRDGTFSKLQLWHPKNNRSK